MADKFTFVIPTAIQLSDDPYGYGFITDGMTVYVEDLTKKHGGKRAGWDIASYCSKCSASSGGVCKTYVMLHGRLHGMLKYFKVLKVEAVVNRVDKSPHVLPTSAKTRSHSDKKQGDHRGHIVARQLGGLACPFNLVPMHPQTNVGFYRDNERRMEELASLSGGWQITIDLRYKPFHITSRPIKSVFVIPTLDQSDPRGCVIPVKNYRKNVIGHKRKPSKFANKPIEKIRRRMASRKWDDFWEDRT